MLTKFDILSSHYEWLSYTFSQNKKSMRHEHSKKSCHRISVFYVTLHKIYNTWIQVSDTVN